MKRLPLTIAATAVLLLALGPARAHEGLEAGAAVRSIVPPPELMGQVYSVAGGKHPTMVLDPIEARALAIASDDAHLIIVAVDLLGLFHEDVAIIRDQVRAVAGNDVEVIVASTHTHSSIDTLGIYGPSLAESGINDEYQAFVRAQASEAAIAANAALEPVTMTVGRLDAPAGTNEFDRNQHPGSFDDGVTAIRFDGTSGAVGTLVNWASHPELIDPDSSGDPGFPAGEVIISSDYVHTLRTTVEDAGAGTAVFVNGPIGAVTALAMPIIDPSTSEPFPRRSVAKARHVGEVIGQTALDALDAGITVDAPPMEVEKITFDLPVENEFILALRAIGTLQRQLYVAGVPLPFGTDVRTEMVRVGLGPIEFLTTPGELQPDLYTGGYLPDEEKANPDVPEEQPVIEQMTGDFRFIIGLGQDELGYFVSATDYTYPSLWPIYSDGEDRNGVEHYQETLSIGRDTARRLSQYASMLLGTTPEPDYIGYPGGFLTPEGTPLYGTQTDDVRGIWVDTSKSGRYESGEDAAVFAPFRGSSDYGYLDSRAHDIGTELNERARGVWIDGDGDGVFDPRVDSHLFFDSYATGEDEPAP